MLREVSLLADEAHAEALADALGAPEFRLPPGDATG